MNIEIFDITGVKKFYRYNDGRKVHEEFLRDVLITSEKHPNKEPYLQNPQTPILDDILDDYHRVQKNNCKFLEDILKYQATEDLRAYFKYQNVLLQGNESAVDQTIILVPDNYDQKMQECILSTIDRPREKTRLLWRSVAACLGAKEKLLCAGAKEGSRVSVIDIQAETISISSLTMERDGSELVPARKAFFHGNREHNPVRYDAHLKNYPLNNGKLTDCTSFLNIDKDFWRCAYNRYNLKNCLLPDHGAWVFRDIPERRQTYMFNSFIFNYTDFIIVTRPIANLQGVPEHRCRVLYASPEQDFLADGAAAFVEAYAKDAPTYFDEVEELSLIIQDEVQETIVPKVLIPGDAWCRGGKEIVGEINRDCYLERENSKLRLYMGIGEITEQSPLNFCEHDFYKELPHKQQLTLKPSMIPGQGFARILVEAGSIIPQVEINSAMDIAKEEDGSNTTLKSMVLKIKRSFPVDFPAVEANIPINVRKLNDYMNDGWLWDSSMLAQSRFPNANIPLMDLDSPLDRFKRENVFGNEAGHTLPQQVSQNKIEEFFNKLHSDYKKACRTGNDDLRRDVIRLVAWTYQAKEPGFQVIINDTLQRLKDQQSMSQQEFTICANMLSTPEQQKSFLNYFIAHAKKQIDSGNGKITKVDNWLRALSELLTYNKDCLKTVDTKICNRIAELLLEILKVYIEGNKAPQYVKYVIKSLLFLLKRRKNDRDFLRTGMLYQKMNDFFEEINSSLIYRRKAWLELSKHFQEFLNGNGTLDGIPVGDGDD